MSCFDVLTPTALLDAKDDLKVPDKLLKLIEIYGHETTVEIPQNSEDPELKTVKIKPDIDPDDTQIQFISWRSHVRKHKSEIFPKDPNKSKTINQLFQYMHTSRIFLGMPYVYKLYCIFLTIPATTASSERSFSKLKIIKNYRRSTMSQDRHSGLAILSIEKDLANNVDFDAVIQVFAKMGSRRMDL